MKKLLLPFFTLAALASVAPAAHAQASLVHAVSAGIGAARMAARNKPAEAKPVAATSSYEGKEFPLQRTAPDKLPKKGAEQITALEDQLETCHAALLASPTGVVCSPEQRKAIQQGAVSVARAQASWDLQPYQQEMAFYLAEDARRQQAAAPVK